MPANPNKRRRLDSAQPYASSPTDARRAMDQSVPSKNYARLGTPVTLNQTWTLTNTRNPVALQPYPTALSAQYNPPPGPANAPWNLYVPLRPRGPTTAVLEAIRQGIDQGLLDRDVDNSRIHFSVSNLPLGGNSLAPPGLMLRFALRSVAPYVNYAPPGDFEAELISTLMQQIARYRQRAIDRPGGVGHFSSLADWTSWPRHSNPNRRACAHCIDEISAGAARNLPARVVYCSWTGQDEHDFLSACVKCVADGVFCMVPDSWSEGPIVMPLPIDERIFRISDQARLAEPNQLGYWIDPARLVAERGSKEE